MENAEESSDRIILFPISGTDSTREFVPIFIQQDGLNWLWWIPFVLARISETLHGKPMDFGKTLHYSAE